ncbi:unnamed protein product, partial [Mesorhabditis belari]|uniref:18S rRNA (Guanine-N(7))-methyltransferase n=1 Tax=Mesorhabditis belari TaxID=2138241 RepID=A0AAF3E9L5_9BILA
MNKRDRPERVLPPDLYYNEEEAAKYTMNSHIVSIQTDMSERAVELLVLPEDKTCMLLDIGCGSGISGSVISSSGHQWIGLDISRPMLMLCKDDEDFEGDLIHKDMGTGLPFRPGVFDGCISISAIQWLCHANTSSEIPSRRLHRFFQSLYSCLSRGARAVFQFYPEDDRQTEMIMSMAQKAGFDGGLVVDYPHSAKAKKIYLVLMTGGMQKLPSALTGEEVDEKRQAECTQRRNFVVDRKQNKRAAKGSKAWITQKVEAAKKRGRDFTESKYSGRKRKARF